MDDMMTGRGFMVWADGRRYDGEWFENRCNGRGVLTYKDGRRYEVGSVGAGACSALHCCSSRFALAQSDCAQHSTCSCVAAAGLTGGWRVPGRIQAGQNAWARR